MVKILNAVVDNRALTDTLFAIAKDSVTSCDDRTALGVNKIEVALVRARANAGDVSFNELIEIGEGVLNENHERAKSVPRIKA